MALAAATERICLPPRLSQLPCKFTCDTYVAFSPTCHTAPLMDKPWISAIAAVAPEAEVVPPSEPRRRPLIYVYDLPPE